MKNYLPGSKKPVREGVYERRMRSGGTAFSLWKDDVWMGLTSKYYAPLMQVKSVYQNLPWRGMTK